MQRYIFSIITSVSHDPSELILKGRSHRTFCSIDFHSYVKIRQTGNAS